MERIVIIWLSPTCEQRRVFEMAAGDMVESHRIFEKISRLVLAEKEKDGSKQHFDWIRFFKGRKQVAK